MRIQTVVSDLKRYANGKIKPPISLFPLNVICLDDAGRVRISPPGDAAESDAAHMDLRPFANAAGAKIHVAADKNAPPSDSQEIVDLVKSRAWSQFVILYDSASPFAGTLAMMALEQGYDVYVVFTA